MENKANGMKDYSILRLDRQRFAKRGSYNFGGDMRKKEETKAEEFSDFLQEPVNYFRKRKVLCVIYLSLPFSHKLLSSFLFVAVSAFLSGRHGV